MLVMRISPVPITHLRLAIYCATIGNAFKSPASRDVEDAAVQVHAVRRLRHIVNAHLTLDPALDAEAQDIFDETLEADRQPTSRPTAPDSATSLSDGRRTTRSGVVPRAPSTALSARELRKLSTASATVAGALVALGAGDDDDAAVEDCGTVGDIFDKFADLRRSWRGDVSMEPGDEDDLDGVPIEDELDGRSLDEDVDGMSIDGFDEA